MLLLLMLLLLLLLLLTALSLLLMLELMHLCRRQMYNTRHRLRSNCCHCWRWWSRHCRRQGIHPARHDRAAEDDLLLLLMMR